MYTHMGGGYGERGGMCRRCKYLCCNFMSICIWNVPSLTIEKVSTAQSPMSGRQWQMRLALCFPSGRFSGTGYFFSREWQSPSSPSQSGLLSSSVYFSSSSSSFHVTVLFLHSQSHPSKGRQKSTESTMQHLTSSACEGSRLLLVIRNLHRALACWLSPWYQKSTKWGPLCNILF